MQFSIMKMEKRHIKPCAELFIDTFSRDPWNDSFSSIEEVETYFLSFFEYNSFLGFVGTADQEIAALCLGMKKPWMKGIEYYIDQFCVAHSLQRQGIGSLFLAEIQRYLDHNNMNGILLNTEKSFPAYEFYLKNGFRELDGLVCLGRE